MPPYTITLTHPRPFETLRNALFQLLISKLSCGQMVCPSTDTIRAESELVAKNIKISMREAILNAQEGTRSLSADGWTAM